MAKVKIQNESHWHELRAGNIGGSEVAALFGASSYMTKLELWLVKSGKMDGSFSDNDRTFWGRHIEQAIASGVAAKTGWQVVNEESYVTCDDVAGMGCTPDRIIMAHPEKQGRGVMQIKNVDRLEFMRWEDGQPPLSMQLQLQHEIACEGVSWGVLAVLVGGNDLKLFTYDAHPPAIAKIKAEVAAFWDSVRAGVQPKAVADDYDTLREIGGGRDEEIDLTGDNRLPELCAEAEAAAKERLAAEKREKAAKAEILEKLQGCARARCNGFFVKVTQVVRAGYEVKPSTYNKLTIKEEKASE